MTEPGAGPAVSFIASKIPSRPLSARVAESATKTSKSTFFNSPLSRLSRLTKHHIGKSMNFFIAKCSPISVTTHSSIF